MGNKLCAPLWKKHARGEGHHWTHTHTSHLLRLWAEIFRVVSDQEHMTWGQVSEDIVPVNIALLDLSPPADGVTVYHVSAYNRQVDKIFDVTITQPGTKLHQPAECFVHWRDAEAGCEWGLNFTSPLDAQRFRETCAASVNGPPRKCNSHGSLKHYSPKKRHQSGSQNSEVGTPGSRTKRSASAPHDLVSSVGVTLPKTDITASAEPAYEGLGTRVHISEEDDEGVYENVEPAPHQQTGYDNVDLPARPQTPQSPEWPPPPPDSQLLTPEDDTSSRTAAAAAARVDSAALRRMLRSVPSASGGPERRLYAESHQKIYRGSISSVASGVSSRVLQMGGAGSRVPPPPQPPAANAAPSVPVLRNPAPCGAPPRVRVRDSYPDSGISGMTGGGASSVKSDGTRGSAGATLPGNLPGFRSNSAGRPSSLGSFGDAHSQLRDTTPDSVPGFVVTSSEFSGDMDEADDDESMGTSHSDVQTSGRNAGACRKAGWLVVKNWLVHKKRRVELSSRRNWRRYWVCLKGTTLQFFTDAPPSTEDAKPRHMLLIDGSIAQAVPEHPKRDHIFALSTAFGDAFLMQATSQMELEGWVSGIHSACASSFARQHGKDNTLKLLRSQIHKLEGSIDVDTKMRKMGELQLSVVQNAKNRQAIVKQVSVWEDNLQKLHVEQYRLRCYAASLQGSELPNPKSLLSNVTRATKSSLTSVGLTVTSLHAYVCAKTPSSAAHVYSRYRRKGMMSVKSESKLKKFKQPVRAFTPGPTQSLPTWLGQAGAEEGQEEGEVVHLSRDIFPDTPHMQHAAGDSLVRVSLPNDQSVIIASGPLVTWGEVLEAACTRRQLPVMDHFLRVRTAGREGVWHVPGKSATVHEGKFSEVEVLPKTIYQVEVQRRGHEDLGFSLEAELADDSDREDDLCVFLDEISVNGPAHHAGLQIGDEILVINGHVIAELDMVYIESLISYERTVTLTVRSCRTDRPAGDSALRHTDVYIEELVCPPPPLQSRISDKIIEDLIVPAPSWVQEDNSSGSGDGLTPGSAPLRVEESVRPLKSYSTSNGQIDRLLEETERVTYMCRSQPSDLTVSSPASSDTAASPGLSPAHKMRKVIVELLDTERAYVKDLECLMTRYLEPLRDEWFCTEALSSLHSSVADILSFQRRFLQALADAVDLEPGFLVLSGDTQQFRHVLFSLAGSFCFYANQFKVYSSFCAAHGQAQKLLAAAEDNAELAEFLRARNPKQQHSSTLESFLIKPIQRVLKYPLLLRQLRELTPPDADEHKHLADALQGMEAVAEHINEMQKIYDEFGAVFASLQAENTSYHQIDLSVSELQLLGPVEFVAGNDDIVKRIKKGAMFSTQCFVFRSAVVLLVREKSRAQRRKSKAGPPAPDVPVLSVAVPVAEAQVRVSAPAAPDLHVWQLVHSRTPSDARPETVYTLASGASEARAGFLRCINQMIREHVRQLSPPSLGNHHHAPPPDKSYSLSRTAGQKASTLLSKRHSAYLDTYSTTRGRAPGLLPTVPSTESDSQSADSSASFTSGSDRRHDDRATSLRRHKAPSVLPTSPTCPWTGLSTNQPIVRLNASNGPMKPPVPNEPTFSPVWRPRRGPTEWPRAQHDAIVTPEVETYDNVMSSADSYNQTAGFPSENTVVLNHPNVYIEYEDDITEC